MSNGTQSIDRAAEVVALIVQAAEPLSYTQIVEKTDLARSTASRLLQALERNGLIERDKAGRYRGGTLFAQYAIRFDRVQSIVTAARPILERIGRQTGETVNLGMISGDTFAHVDQVDSNYVLSATNWVNVEVPSHTSALGKVMYAFGAITPPKGRLQRRTPRTLTSRAGLDAELAAVRESGYAVTHGEFEEGLDAVAAPVRWPDDVVRAAIGVSGPSVRFASEHHRYGRLLIAEAARLSALIGHADITG